MGRPKKATTESSQLDGLKLKAVRESLGLTQLAMSELAGWCESKQSRIERNKAKISDMEIREAVKAICQRHEEINLTYEFFQSSIDIESFLNLISKNKDGLYQPTNPIHTEPISTGIIGRHKDIEQLHNISSELTPPEFNMTSIDSYSRYNLLINTLNSIKKSCIYDKIIWYPSIRTDPKYYEKTDSKIVYKIDELFEKIIISFNHQLPNHLPVPEEQKKIVTDLLCRNKTILVIDGIGAVQDAEFDIFLHSVPALSKAIIIDTKNNIISYICDQVVLKMSRYMTQFKPSKKQKLVDANKELLAWAMDDLKKMEKFKKYRILYLGVEFPKGFYEKMAELL